MHTAVVKQGNMYMLSLAPELLQQVSITESELLQVFEERGRLVIQKATPPPTVPNAAKTEELLNSVKGNYKILANGKLRTKKTTYQQRYAGLEGKMVCEEWDTGPPVGSEVY